MMMSNRKRCAAAGLAALLGAAPVAAQQLPLCQYLDTLVEAAANDFVALRGPFDFGPERYAGKLSTPGYNQCDTETDDGHTRYFCRRTMPDDAAAAKAEWEGMAARAKACFAGRERHTNRGERYLNFSTRPHGAHVTARYQRLARKGRDAIYSITLEVGVTDPNR